MSIEFNRNLGDTPIIALPSFDVLPTPNTTTGVTDSSATADTNISLQKEGTIATPSVDLAKMGAQAAPDTTTPTASPYFKHAAIGLGGLVIVGLIWFLAKRKHSERAVYQNPERYKPDYKVVNDIKDKFVTLYKSGTKGLGTIGLNFINDLQYYGFTRKDATKTVQAALAKAWDEIYQKNPSNKKYYVALRDQLFKGKPFFTGKEFKRKMSDEEAKHLLEKGMIREYIDEPRKFVTVYDPEEGTKTITWGEYLKKRRKATHNPYNPAEKVFTDFHGFEPTKLKEVSVPDEYPDELVLIGKADEVLYRSNKKNGAPNRDGKEKTYVHDFKKGALWATDKEGKGFYLINPDLKVKPEGLVH